MNTFKPTLFAITKIHHDDVEGTATKILVALHDICDVAGHGVKFATGSVAFVDQHPENSAVRLEIQSIEAEAHAEAQRIMTELALTLEGIAEKEITWDDISEEAIAHRAAQERAKVEVKEEAETEVVPEGTSE